MNYPSHRRVAELKILKAIANSHLEFYKNAKPEKSKKWITRKSSVAIEALKTIIQKINTDLHPKKVKAFCSPPSSLSLPLSIEFSSENSQERVAYLEYYTEVFSQTKPQFVLFELARLAPELNIIHDISWITDGMLSDFIDIQLGNKDISFLETFLSFKIKEISGELLPALKKDSDLKKICGIILQAIKSTNEGNYLTSNILLITAAESFVRRLAFRLHRLQNPELSNDESYFFVYKKFSSLESLILKGKWPYDFPTSFADALVKYKDVDNERLNEIRVKHKRHTLANSRLQEMVQETSVILQTHESEEELRNKLSHLLNQMYGQSPNLMSDEEKTIKVNLSIMLDFLVRKYKDDRNSIIHGDFECFDLKWKNYINYAALMKISEVFKEYQELYTSGPSDSKML